MTDRHRIREDGSGAGRRQKKNRGYGGYSLPPNAPFRFAHLSVEAALRLQVKTAYQRAIIGGIRDSWERTHPDESGTCIPIHDVLGSVARYERKHHPKFSRAYNELKNTYPESNIYLGLNSFLIPAVYYWAFQTEDPPMRDWLSDTLQDLLARAEAMGSFLTRKFTQKRHLQENEMGSRQVSISFEEYSSILLRQPFVPADRTSPCIFCLRGPAELDMAQRTVHHILPKGSFRSYHDELIQYLQAHNLAGRSLGDFGKNQIMICRTPCHDSFENLIEANIVHSSKHPDKGVLFVADLYIMLARAFANHHLYHQNLEHPKIYEQTVDLENRFLLSLFRLYAPNGETRKSAKKTKGDSRPPFGNILRPE
ncbi:MAG: hypothetical protein V1728_05260 [Candidatus Micrarchaeota archaeon]